MCKGIIEQDVLITTNTQDWVKSWVKNDKAYM